MTRRKEPALKQAAEKPPRKPGAKTARKRGNGPVAASRAPVPADAFAVTAATSTLSLGPDRVGYLTCTVTNTTGETLRGQARLRARPPEVLDWLSIAEEMEGDYDPGASKPFTVRIEAPPDAPVGKYAFRMVAMSAEEPERVCTEGPVVNLIIPQPRFIRLLPGVFQRGAPSGSPLFALLQVMEQMYGPGERLLNAIEDTFNPYRTPDAFVPYLASWVDLDRLLVENPAAYQTGELPPYPAGLGRLRDLIAVAAELSRWRGTARGLTQFLETATGIEGVRIEEQPPGPDGRPTPFHMIVHVPAAGEAYRALIERLVRMEKPAYMTYQILFE